MMIEKMRMMGKGIEEGGCVMMEEGADDAR